MKTLDYYFDQINKDICVVQSTKMFFTFRCYFLCGLGNYYNLGLQMYKSEGKKRFWEPPIMQEETLVAMHVENNPMITFAKLQSRLFCFNQLL